MCMYMYILALPFKIVQYLAWEIFKGGRHLDVEQRSEVRIQICHLFFSIFWIIEYS